MASSSEDNFAWTDTSKDSESSTMDENKSSPESKHSKKRKSSARATCNGTDDDMDIQTKVKIEKSQFCENTLDKSIKKKKIKLEIESDFDTKKKKKKKNKHVSNNDELEDSISYDENYLDMRVKEEKIANHKKKSLKIDADDSIEIKLRNTTSESFEDNTLESSQNSSTKKKKKKKSKRSESDREHDQMEIDDDNQIEHVEDNNGLEDSVSYDEDYLDKRVKEEKIANQKTKSLKMDTERSSVIKPQNTTPESFEDNTLESSQYSSKSKKKKKKSKRSESDREHDTVEIDEQEITEKAAKKKKKYNTTAQDITETSIDYTMSQDDTACSEISAIQCDDDQNIHVISFNDSKTHSELKKIKSGSLYKSTIVGQFKKGNCNTDQDTLMSHPEKRTPCVSDRIRFEDEEDLETETSHSQTNGDLDQISHKLKKYMKTNSDMNVVSQELPKNSVVSREDEIWIMKCPKDIDVEDLCGIDLNLDKKCKIKLNGQAYDATLEEEECATTATLTMKHTKYAIENLPLKGIISLRKRIPKAQFHYDNIMVNNQTNFIPLPETKCRHPLFGSNYKKALKIPAAIAERLKPQYTEAAEITEEKLKKKKHKKNKRPNKTEFDENNEDSPLKTESSHTNERKKRKRKLVDDEDSTGDTRKVKRVKQDTDAELKWDSAKEIERNLFGF